MPSESPCLSKMLLGPYHSRTHQPWTTPSVTAASTRTVSIPGSVGSLWEEATATTAFFEIPAISLLGAELLPLPGNPWICDIWQLREDPQHWSQAIANACLSELLIWWAVLYLAQLGALLFIADMNSLESLWAFVSLAFYQSGNVPQLLQPEDGLEATHIISPLRGRFVFHRFTHHGKNFQVSVGHPLNST